MPDNNLTINYTAMPAETVNQTGSRRVMTTSLQESDSPATYTAPQIPDQFSAMMASIVEAKLANVLNSRSISGPVVPPKIKSALRRSGSLPSVASHFPTADSGHHER